jgi:hypothetical protein
MIVRGPTKPKRNLITILYYVTEEESVEFKKMAFFMNELKAIPRPTVGAFAKAAGYKWFNEINQIAMAKGKLSATSKKENRDSTTN